MIVTEQKRRVMAPLSSSDSLKNTSVAIITNMQLNSAQDCMDQEEKNTNGGNLRHNVLQRKKKKENHKLVKR